MNTVQRLRTMAALVGGLGGLTAPSAEAIQDGGLGSPLQNAGISRSLTGNSSTGAAHSNRVDPRLQGVNITFSPTRFNYVHDYPFENLSKEATAVYFLLPLNCQEHTITSAKYTVVGSNTPLKYDVVAETPGWKVARAEVPPSKNFTVRMAVSGVHWNGHLAKSPQEVSDIAPPPISDEQMKWYALKSPFVAQAGDTFAQFLTSHDLSPLSSDFTTALSTVMGVMAKNFKYDPSSPRIEDILTKGTGNCNGTNGFVEGVFDATPGYVGVFLNGIIMDGGDIHAMSMVGKSGWSHLVPTDGVKFNDGNLDPYYLSGHSPMGPMLLFQAGFGDPSIDPKGGVTFRPTETGRVNRAPNPGGMMWAFGGGEKLSYSGGKKASFETEPVKDLAALRRELGLVSQVTNGGAGGLSSEVTMTVTNNPNSLAELIFSGQR